MIKLHLMHAITLMAVRLGSMTQRGHAHVSWHDTGGIGGDHIAASRRLIQHKFPGLWRTSRPYLFLVFTVKVGLVVVVLHFIACMRCKPSNLAWQGSAT